MKKAIKILSLVDVIFLILLMASGTLNGIASDVAYFLAFLIPFAIAFYYSRELRTEREEVCGVSEPLDTYLRFDKSKVTLLLPLITPCILIVFTLAALTSLLLSVIGFSNPQPQDTGIFTMLLVHAVCPAVLEELLFRYIPMKLIAPYSGRWCVVFSSLFFALIHANLFQMPYAFVAGALFMCVNLAFNSLWPSLILHLINNAASVIWMKYCTDVTAMLIFTVVVLSLAIVSGVFVFLRRDRYKSYLRSALSKGECEFDMKAPVALIVISLYISLMSLFA